MRLLRRLLFWLRPFNLERCIDQALSDKEYRGIDPHVKARAKVALLRLAALGDMDEQEEAAAVKREIVALRAVHREHTP